MRLLTVPIHCVFLNEISHSIPLPNNPCQHLFLSNIPRAYGEATGASTLLLPNPVQSCSLYCIDGHVKIWCIILRRELVANMMTNLYFVRHAHSVYSPDERNRPLSERGHQDAARVGELLEPEHIHVLLSSPYKRAVQTIEGLADRIGSGIILEEDFRERLLSEQPVDDFEHAIAPRCGRTLLSPGRAESPIRLPNPEGSGHSREYWNNTGGTTSPSGLMEISWYSS